MGTRSGCRSLGGRDCKDAIDSAITPHLSSTTPSCNNNNSDTTLVSSTRPTNPGTQRWPPATSTKHSATSRPLSPSASQTRPPPSRSSVPSSPLSLSKRFRNHPPHDLIGWTGAKLAQLLQEAALVAVRNKHDSILQSDGDDAVDRLTVGPKHVGIDLGFQGQCQRAATEVGLAITSHLLRRYEKAKVEFCQRISINPRGQVLLGGRAAEEVIYGRGTSRASVNYLADASWLAHKILTIWNLDTPMTIHGEPPPWRKNISFVGPRLDFEGLLYDENDLIEPPVNFNLDDHVARRAEELIHNMDGRTLSLLRQRHATLVKTVRVGFSRSPVFYLTFLVLIDRKEISGDQIEYILNNYPSGTPVILVLEEENPGSLPLLEAELGHDLVLTSYASSEEEIAPSKEEIAL